MKSGEERVRVRSVDVLRGLTMACMVVVNNPGSWDHVYPPLEHAAWNGCTPTDLIFPFFLFLVGVSMWFSLRSYEAGEGERRADFAVWRKVVTRSGIIVLLGLGLNFVPAFDLAHLRVPGVLQRIGVCYLVGAALLLTCRGTWRMVIAGVIVGWYAWLVWGGDGVTPESNIVRSVDLMWIGADHLYRRGGATDPEGLLSTLPAAVTVIVGTFSAKLLWGTKPPRSWVAFALGGLWVVSGWGIARFGNVPLNKAMWSPTYVMFTAGIALLVLWTLHWAIDTKGWGRFVRGFELMGTNSILLFVGSGLLGRLLNVIQVPEAAAGVSLGKWIYLHGCASWAGPLNGSLAYALGMLAFWWVVLYVLWMKKIQLKV